METNSTSVRMKGSRFRDEVRDSHVLIETPSLRSPQALVSPPILPKIENEGSSNVSGLRKISKFLQEYRGSIQAVEYRQTYGFSEKWEVAGKQNQEQLQRFVDVTGRHRWISFALFPALLLHLWFVSVFRVFKYTDDTWVFSLGLVLQLAALGFQGAVLVSQAESGEWRQVMGRLGTARLTTLCGNFYSLVYHIGALSGCGLANQEHLLLWPLDLLLMAHKYRQLEEIYSAIRIEVIGSRYRLFMHLFDLAGNILVMVHVFATLLFLCTYYQPQNNWRTLSPINATEGWAADYLESFYFACTTMLTVGFGDLRPTNLLEVFCILLVQLVGIMNNAYVISEIGANLAQLHEKRNTLERDVANAQRMARDNCISDLARNRMLSQLIRNQAAHEELSVVDESALLGKLTEEFGSEVRQSSQLRAIKRSLFLISNFSRRFHDEAARRLVKAIYPPHAVLPNHIGRERLYIISKGSVDILTDRKMEKTVFSERVLKSLDLGGGEKGLNDVYGYTAAFSGRLSRIKAVARSFVVCYYLEQADILECVSKSAQDFQRYFQFKHRLELSRFPEKQEVSRIASHRQHYFPNIFILMRRCTETKKKKSRDGRKRLIRRQRRLAKVLEKFEEEGMGKQDFIQESIDSIPSSNFQEQSNRKIGTILPRLTVINSPLINKPRNYQGRAQAYRQYMELRKQKLDQKLNQQLELSIFTESAKQYKNYFPKGNLPQIIAKYNNSRRFKERSQTELASLNSTRLDMLKYKRKQLI